jgi:hypothetical protein
MDKRISIDLDRPAPAGCALQLWRYSKRSGTRGYGIKRQTRRAFRPILLNSDGWPSATYHVAIPPGATTFSIPTPRQLYKPVKIRGKRWPFKPGNAYIGGMPMDRQRPNKVHYKIGVQRGGALGVMSSETLEIMFHYGWGKPRPAGQSSYLLTAKVY